MAASIRIQNQIHNTVIALNTDNRGTADKGRAALVNALRSQGARVAERRSGHIVFLEVTKLGAADRVLVRVKTRTGGTWQGSTRDGDPDPPPSRPTTYWAFVDLKNPSAAAFYIAPDEWVRRDIHAAHQLYLARHGGERAISKDSNHHAIDLRRILEWRDRWDLIGL